jgi:hypothetical protein
MEQKVYTATNAWRTKWIWVLAVFLSAWTWYAMRNVEDEHETLDTRFHRADSPETVGKTSSFQYLPTVDTEQDPNAVFASIPEPDLRSLRYLLSLQKHGAFAQASAAASNEYETSRIYQQEMRLKALAELYPEAHRALLEEGRGGSLFDVLRDAAVEGSTRNQAVFIPEQWSQLQGIHQQNKAMFHFEKELAEANNEKERAWVLKRKAMYENMDVIPGH